MAKRHLTAFVVVIALVVPGPIARAEEAALAGNPPARDLPDVPALRIDDPASDSEMVDLATLAEQMQMPLQEAIDRYGWTDNFALAVEMIREEFPDAFSGAEIVDGRTAWVAFADTAPTAAVEIIGTFERANGAVVIQIRPNFGMAEAAILKAVENVHYAVVNAAGEEVTTSFDYSTRQITSVVAWPDPADIGAFEELRIGAAQSLAESDQGASPPGISVSVLRSSLSVLGYPTLNSATIGGEDLSGCTSGFTVYHWSGYSGVATAGHCNNAQSDDGYSLPYYAGYEGQYGDFQWNRAHSGIPVWDDFYAGNSTTWEVDRRDVSGVYSPAVGQVLCKNGYAGFKDCGSVKKVNVCYALLCNLVQMENHASVSGDSGGPYYWGNAAYGLMYGWQWDPIPPWARDLFSRADHIGDALEVQIKH